ncbi:hypothetical protein ASF44_30355 [Pseudorhodoferax sp. Leaf274]|nr:hypothetical protein ASF44_30355 [Pseudorhodoferax sp. Leaf274]
MQISGELSGSPFPGACHEAQLGVMPLVRPHEYAEAMRFERPSRAPVLLSPSQRYLLLKNLVIEMRRSLPEISVFGVRLFGPDFNVQLPRELLSADVFITHAPLDLLPTLLESGTRNIVLIHHGLRADPIEQGDNELVIWLLASGPELRAGVETFLRESEVLRVLGNLRLRSVLAEEMPRLGEIARIGLRPSPADGSAQ